MTTRASSFFFSYLKICRGRRRRCCIGCPRGQGFLRGTGGDGRMLKATETTHRVYKSTTARARARISKQKILNGRGEVANRQHVEALRGTGENLVPEQTREMEEGTHRDYRTCKQEQLYFEWQPYCRADSNTCKQNQREESPCFIVLNSHLSMIIHNNTQSYLIRRIERDTSVC